MDSPELLELKFALTRLEAEVDELPLSERERLAGIMREALKRSGELLLDADEEVLGLYCEGILDFRHLHDHFRPRLFNGLNSEGRNDA
jgi:hypothetical protein